jgi:hypothetical protein
MTRYNDFNTREGFWGALALVIRDRGKQLCAVAISEHRRGVAWLAHTWGLVCAVNFKQGPVMERRRCDRKTLAGTYRTFRMRVLEYHMQSLAYSKTGVYTVHNLCLQMPWRSEVTQICDHLTMQVFTVSLWSLSTVQFLHCSTAWSSKGHEYFVEKSSHLQGVVV